MGQVLGINRNNNTILHNKLLSIRKQAETKTAHPRSHLTVWSGISEWLHSRCDGGSRRMYLSLALSCTHTYCWLTAEPVANTKVKIR